MTALPSSDEAEKGVLSCFLQDPAKLYEAQENLPSPWFYHPANRLLYEILLRLYADGTPIDIVTLGEHLLTSGQMDKIGGPAMLGELYNFVPTAQHYPYYCGMLHDKFLLRELYKFGAKLMEQACSNVEDIPALLDATACRAVQLQQDAAGVAGRKDGYTIPEIYDEWEAGREALGGSGGLPIPDMPWLTEQLMGCQQNHVIQLAGPRGCGKTVLAWQIAYSLARDLRVPAAYISLEQSRQQMLMRAMCHEGVHPTSWAKQQFSEEELEIVQRVKATKAPIKIHTDVRSLDAIMARVRGEVQKRNIRLLVVDGPARIDGNRQKGESRPDELSRIVWSFKELADAHGLTVILLAHINDAGGIFGSKEVEGHVDAIINVVAESAKKYEARTQASRLLNPGRSTIFKFVKNRMGEEGKRGIMRLVGEHFRFIEEGPTTEDIEYEKKYD